MPGYIISSTVSIVKRCCQLDSRTSLDNVLGRLALVLGEVLTEQLAKLDNLLVEAVVASGPSVLGVEELVGNVGAGLGDLEVEDFVVLVLDICKLTRMDSIENSTSVLERATLATLEGTGTDPTGVQEPSVGLVLLDLVRKHLGVPHGVKSQERLSEAAGEGSLGLSDTILSASHLGSVARNEVEHGLGAVELGDRGENTTCVAGEEDDVAGRAF